MSSLEFSRRDTAKFQTYLIRENKCWGIRSIPPLKLASYQFETDILAILLWEVSSLRSYYLHPIKKRSSQISNALSRSCVRCADTEIFGREMKKFSVIFGIFSHSWWIFSKIMEHHSFDDLFLFVCFLPHPKEIGLLLKAGSWRFQNCTLWFQNLLFEIIS